jgi:hypothetical protein
MNAENFSGTAPYFQDGTISASELNKKLREK